MKFTRIRTIRAGLSQFGRVCDRVREPSCIPFRLADLIYSKRRSTGIGGPVSRNGKLYPPDTHGMGGVPDADTPVALTEEFRL